VNHLSNIPKDDTRLEVALDVCLLKGYYFRAEHMLNLEVDSVIFLETYILLEVFEPLKVWMIRLTLTD